MKLKGVGTSLKHTVYTPLSGVPLSGELPLSGARHWRLNCCFPYKPCWLSGESLLAERGIGNQGTPLKGVFTVFLKYVDEEEDHWMEQKHFCCPVCPRAFV